MFATSPPLKCDKAWNPACDGTLTQNKYQSPNDAFTGLTTIQNYATLGADVGIIVQAGKFVRFHAGFQYTHDQPHNLTVDDVGKALENDFKTPLPGGRVHTPASSTPPTAPSSTRSAPLPRRQRRHLQLRRLGPGDVLSRSLYPSRSTDRMLPAES